MHTVHVLKNSAQQIYIAVRGNKYWNGDVVGNLTTIARNCDWDRFKNDINLNSFLVENEGDVTHESYPYTGEFHHINSRIEETSKWVAMGYPEFVRTETEAKIVAQNRVKKEDDRSADGNFGSVIKNISSVPQWAAYYGSDVLLKARKTLTVGEMVKAYPWPPVQEKAA